MAVADQLAEIQRSLGGIESTVGALKENQEDDHHETVRFQQDTTSKIANALERIGKLEDDVNSLKLVVEKTVKPLALGAGNIRQRIIGFMAAMSLIGVAGSVAFWVISNFWTTVQRIIHNIS